MISSNKAVSSLFVVSAEDSSTKTVFKATMESDVVVGCSTSSEALDSSCCDINCVARAREISPNAPRAMSEPGIW